ncbi:hypothetical protein U9M48_024860 [Paspalum notatum var. saurae]|uniref:Uncharacterized protein n=1 Tax=Paspalum notatum var. saurae TaxID=547442 RepID=A0AAQ3WWF4_PASNO
MEQSSDGMPISQRRRRRANSSINHSSKSDAVVEDMSDIPRETARHCQDAESEKTEGPPHKEIAHCFEESSSKTIRRWTMRWKYILDPAINKGPWSQQEELRLIRAHQIYGNKWCKMVKHFPGRTNDALKGHWRGSMKSKLESYLASGLLEQVPDLQEDISPPQSSQLDISKNSEVASDRNRISSLLTTNSKLKQEPVEMGENDDTSVGKSSDFIFAASDVHCAKVSEITMAKSRKSAGARKKLASLSTPVELKPRAHCPRKISKASRREEDEILTKMVAKHGLKNWQTIASAIPGRDGKQCRIRWTRSLDPAINKEDWSEQEELKLIRAHQIYGNQWLKMVKHFPGRTNHGLKEHWRGRMKGKLNFYLASGLLEQVPDLQDLSDPESSQSDIPKDSQGSSNRNRPSSILPTRIKSKRDLPELDENADTSDEENSDGMSPKGLNAHSAKVSEKIMAKSKQRARARRKLDFLSTPVELKECTAAASCQRPPQRMQQTSPAPDNISPLDLPQNVPSECVDTDIPTAATNHPNDVHSPATLDPCSMEIHDVNIDLLDMSYCDGLMIDSPRYPHDSSFMREPLHVRPQIVKSKTDSGQV